MSKRTYFMVLYEQGKPKGDCFAKKSIITEQVANVILSDVGNPLIKRKEDGNTYYVTERRLFEFEKNDDGDKILFLILDVVKK